MADIKLETGEILMSHDVVALFTNVPIDLALTIIKTKLEEDPKFKDRTNLKVDDVCELLSLILCSTYFSYKNTLYQQKFGVAMGGPISPIVANIVMDHMFRKIVKSAPPEKNQESSRNLWMIPSAQSKNQ